MSSAGSAFRMAWLTGTTPMHARLSAMEDCRDPVFLCSELRVITVSPDAEPQMKGIAVAIVAKRIGWTTNVPYAGVLAASAERERIPYLESLVRLARRNPFDQNLCGSILEVVDQWPEMEELIPKRIRLRCAIYKGELGVTPGALVDNRDVGMAADCLVAIQRSMTAGTLNEEQREQTLALARHYGQIQHVAILATQVCSVSSPAYTARMMEHFDQINDGFGYAQAVPRALALAITQQQAENILPIVRATSPQWFEGLEKRQAPVFTDPNDQNERDLWQAVARIWSLTRAKN